MSDKNILEQLVDAIKGTRKSEGNPYHDARGRFTSGGGGGKGKMQKPSSGGSLDSMTHRMASITNKIQNMQGDLADMQDKSPTGKASPGQWRTWKAKYNPLAKEYTQLAQQARKLGHQTDIQFKAV